MLTLPKMSEFVPVPVVWSVEGPVLLLGVAPDPLVHSNLPLLSFFVDQCEQNPLKSKSQSRGPIKRKTITINQNIGHTINQFHAFKGNCYPGSRGGFSERTTSSD